MKRRAVLILGLALMLGMNGCGNSDETVDSNIEQKEDIELEEAIELDVFEGLQVSFEGFNGKGKIKIDTSNCSKEVREYVQFEYETSMDGKLSNEQNIVISAVSKHENLTITEPKCTYTVNGLYMFDEENGNYLGEFSDGMAWFRYINPNDNKTYFAYMDSTGSVKFQFEYSEKDHGNVFKNGNTMIKFNNGRSVAIVDKSGEIIKTIDITKNAIAEANGIENTKSEILLFEEGYCVVKTNVEDFNNKYYIYTIYNSNGECVFIDKMYPENAQDDGHFSGYYRGDNVIFLNRTPDWIPVYFLDENYHGFLEGKYEGIQFNDGYAVYYIDKDQNIIFLLTSKGEIIEKQVSAVDLSNYNVSNISILGSVYRYNHDNGNIMMMHKDKMEYGYYNIENDTFISSSEYASQIEDMPVFCNEVIAARMKGADGEIYVGIFDMNWNLITNPIKGSGTGSFPNGIWICDGYTSNGVTINESNYRYYDYSGNLLFETGDELLEFSEGLAYRGDFQWVNADNEVVIDGLDFSNVKTIQLSEIESEEESYPIEGTYIGSHHSVIKIQNDGTVIYTETEPEEVFNLSITKISDNVWKTSELVYSSGYRCEMILYMDESGNLLADGTNNDWIDEYFIRQ